MNTSPMLERAGRVTPESDEAAGGSGFKGAEEKGNPANSADAQRKNQATFAAQLALAGGWVLVCEPDGSYTVSRWDRTRSFTNLDQVAEFVRLVVGRR